jgi:D-sedoheptulose 7-phosphate isomerase
MTGMRHLNELRLALSRLEHDLDRIATWGEAIAGVLDGGGRLLAAGNGGSAAQAQHLTAELVGRYLTERRPLSAIALHADTSALTAIVNDYGAGEGFARSVRAHGRQGDVLVALSTSGRSGNVLEAVAAARSLGISTLALTGTGPNPLASAADDAVCVDASTPTVQEVHQVAIHLLCEAIDARIAEGAVVGAGRA